MVTIHRFTEKRIVSWGVCGFATMKRLDTLDAGHDTLKRNSDHFGRGFSSFASNAIQFLHLGH
jgi:hypothetical protein